MLKKFISPVILTLLAALSWWYVKSWDKALSVQKPAVTSQGPDYFMFDAVSTVMDESGAPKRQLVTAYLAHFPDDNRTEVRDARLTLHQQDGGYWSVKAEHGTLYQETEQIYLSGKVIIEKPRTETVQNSLKIETEKVSIDPTNQTAQTEDPVIISSEDVRVNAVGMKANFQTKSVELLTKVRGTYAPNR